MSNTPLPTLPLGLASFPLLRQKGRLYVDKTDLLQKLIETGDYYFLSRPRRFGKSLTISTLEAMFQGKSELFAGLTAENWVKKISQHPSPVFCLDFSAFDSSGNTQDLCNWLNRKLVAFAESHEMYTSSEKSPAETFDKVISLVRQKKGLLSLLIDEYDAPLLDNLHDLAKISAFRDILRQFYKAIKACSSSLHFIMITGISTLTKVGIFSAVNNLNDISTDSAYSTLNGYTQDELEKYFSDFINDAVRQKITKTRHQLLERIRNYYDGFSFDGKTKVYNPFSLLNFFREYRFSNYWYESGSVSFIESYFKTHHIASPETYHRIKVKTTALAAREIEEARPESFLLQAGYLTIAECCDDILVLDYPNQEVLNALSEMYLTSIYQIPNYNSVGQRLWVAVRKGDMASLANELNSAIASLPYHDFSKKQKSDKKKHQESKRDESFYRSLLLMLLRGAGLQAHGEVPSCRGRSDVLITSSEHIVIIEFKLARTTKEITSKQREGEAQILASGYLEPYMAGNIPVSYAVLVVDTQKRQIVFDAQAGILCQNLSLRPQRENE
ncbi:MAG: AAA family ATPase [Desulfovibrio sp.]|nr:AAA family ATPase [Desulfovibrio sp.]